MNKKIRIRSVDPSVWKFFVIGILVFVGTQHGVKGPFGDGNDSQISPKFIKF